MKKCKKNLNTFPFHPAGNIFRRDFSPKTYKKYFDLWYNIARYDTCFEHLIPERNPV